MNRTRAWRRWQKVRIRRRRSHYGTVHWAWELGDPRRIDIASEHPQICSCVFCQNHYPPGKMPVELRAPAVPRELDLSEDDLCKEDELLLRDVFVLGRAIEE